MQNLEQIIIARNTLYKTIRSFFETRGYLEVETPILVASPDMSPNLTPFETTVIDTNQKPHQAALITSPEFSMKKLLGLGLQKIFTITKVFRNIDFYPEGESQHNPEFVMLEWYEQGMGYKKGMEETEVLVQSCLQAFSSSALVPFEKIHLPTKFKEITGLELCEASRDDLVTSCTKFGLITNANDTWSDLFHKIVITKIESSLQKNGAFLYDFPLSEAALARKTEDQKYAERFELYLEGVELCNAFGELTDAVEQRLRFEKEQQIRVSLGKSTYPIDEELLRLLPSLQNPTFGNALGIDRLLMILLQKSNLNEILTFPAQKLFS